MPSQSWGPSVSTTSGAQLTLAYDSISVDGSGNGRLVNPRISFSMKSGWSDSFNSVDSAGTAINGARVHDAYSGDLNSSRTWNVSAKAVPLTYGSTTPATFQAVVYGISFFNGDQNTTTYTMNIVFPARPYAAPGVVGAPSATVQDSGTLLELGWSAPSSGSASLDRVQVQILNGATGVTVVDDTVNWTTTYSTTITPGQWYQWRVRARNGHGVWGSWTSYQTLTNTPAAPNTPTVSSITTTGTTVSWNAPADGGAALGAYGVEWQTAGGAAVGSANVSATSRAITGLQPNTEYRVRVRASNTHYQGPYSGWRLFTTAALPPYTPGNLSAARMSDVHHTLTWTQITPGDRPLSSFVVQRQDNVNTDWATVSALAGTSRSYSDTSTGADRLYTWRVRAEGPGGASAWATLANPIATTPKAPSSASASKQADQSILVTFTPASSYAEVSAHQIFESTDGGSTWGSSPLATVPAGTTSWVHSSPNALVTHRYRVRAVSPAPQVLYSSYATTATVQLLAPPNPPTAEGPLGVVDASNDVLLDWGHSTVDSSSQSKFQVRWRVSPSSTWITEAITASSDTSWSVPGGTWTNGNTVEWQVRNWGVYTGPLGSDGAGGSEWSALFSFITRSTPVATITSPPASPVVVPHLDLAWSFFQQQGDTQANWEAELYSGSSATGSPVEIRSGSGTGSSTEFDRLLPDQTSWTVRVRARSSSNQWSEWDTFSFTVDYPEPDPPLAGLTWDHGHAWVSVVVTNPPTGPQVVYNEVQRSVDGGPWVTISPDVPRNGSFEDRTVPPRGVVAYRAIAWTALPSALAGPEAVLQFVDGNAAECDWPGLPEGARRIVVRSAWLSGGPGFSTSLQALLGLVVSETSGLVTRVLQRFAGRTWPVEFSGRARSLEVTLSFEMPYRQVAGEDHLATQEEWRELSFLPGPHLYRDHEGRAFYASMGTLEVEGGKPAVASIILTKVGDLE